MNWKKLLRALTVSAAALIAAGALVSCAPGYEVNAQKGFKQMYAVKQTAHTVGADVKDGREVFSDKNSKSGELFRLENVALNAGVYQFSALLSSDAAGGKDGVACFYVKDADSGEIIAKQEVTKDDFAAANSFAETSVVFPLYRARKVEVSLSWYNVGYLKVGGNLRIQSATEDKLWLAGERGKRVLGACYAKENPVLDENALYVFNLYSYLDSVHNSYDRYDLANLIFTLQGLVNRDKERLFINFTPPNEYSSSTDLYWLNELSRDGFLKDKKIVTVNYPITLLKLFQDKFDGFAVWDERVPATSNAAATACGVDNLLPLRYDAGLGGLAEYMTEEFPAKPVTLDLYGKFLSSGKNSTGSAKNDATLWAKAQYLDTRKTNATLMAYHLDAWTEDGNYRDLYNYSLSNRDYYIANKAFFFDLNPWGDSLPNDEPAQKMGTDYDTMRKVLKTQNAYAGDRITTIGGFVPWHLKYTDYNDEMLPGVVDSEWQSVKIFSEYNCVIDPDAYGYTYMSNASVYSFFPGKDRYENIARTHKLESEEYKNARYENKNYILHYMGDYDASAWLNTMTISTYFNDPARGSIPLMWPIAANAYKRVPHVLDKMYATQTDNDYFVYVNNGIGYLNPLSLSDPNRDKSLNGSLDLLKTEIKKAGQKFDLDVQGLILTDGRLSDSVASMYAETAPYGVVGNFSLSQTQVVMYEDVPFIYEIDFAEPTPEACARKVAGMMGYPALEGEPTFWVFRTTLRTASFIKETYDLVAKTDAKLKTEVLDPYTFFKYVRQYEADKGAK